MEDAERYKSIKKLSFIEKNNHIVLKIKNSPYAIFVWRGTVYWDNIETGDAVSMEEVFDNLSEDAKEQIIFNLYLFK